MTDNRASCWSVTINNPSDQDEECINLARQKGWHVQGQKERGENGTEHYQLMLKTPQVRFSAVKKAFPRAHIEVAKNPVALAKYVQKEETRVGELKQDDSLYPSMSKVWNLFAIHVDDTEGGGGEYLNWKAEKFLKRWDAFIADTIRAGLYVEHIGANPQFRSIVKLYGSDIVTRELSRSTSVNPNSDLETNHAVQEVDVSEEDNLSSSGTDASSSDAYLS